MADYGYKLQCVNENHGFNHIIKCNYDDYEY